MERKECGGVFGGDRGVKRCLKRKKKSWVGWVGKEVQEERVKGGKWKKGVEWGERVKGWEGERRGR